VSQSAYDITKISNFVKSIASNNVVENFEDWAITTSFAKNTDLITVLKTMRKEEIKYVGIISPNGEYLGVALQSEIEHQIANSVLSQQ
jgi:predicted transcriptional regulator